MEVVNLILIVVSLVLEIIILVAFSKNKGKTVLEEKDKKELKDAFSSNVGVISETLNTSNKLNAEMMRQKLDDFERSFSEKTKILSESLDKSNKHSLEMSGEKLESMKNEIKTISDNTNKSLEKMERTQSAEFEQIRKTLQDNLKVLQEGNEKKLTEIQNIVDEKLSKTLNDRFKESFIVLTEQLEKVSKTIGEMQNISSDVGNLTKMLSGVKTAGIFGEIQLKSIIEQILAPAQYVENVVTKEFGREPVEFAIKMPGTDGEEVLMPIDSKFPYTVYNDMQEAYQNNDFAEFDNKKKQLKQTITNMAKDINIKYINPPHTTNFAVMFLPFEGLYAEVVKMGMVETLQQQYNVTVAGPTTMAALLNSLQMGFQTLAIQKKSGEVWQILGAVKNEFSQFDKILTDIQKRLATTNSDLDKLIGTRTRAISRKLRDVQISSTNSAEILGLTDGLSVDEND